MTYTFCVHFVCYKYMRHKTALERGRKMHNDRSLHTPVPCVRSVLSSLMAIVSSRFVAAH